MLSTRRQFLIGGLRVTAVLPLLPHMPRTRRAHAERALVILQLTGGNDGLNTVVPHRQDGYFRARPAIGLKRDALHRLDDDHGLHPALGALGELFAEGRVAVVHGVGYPRPDRSHFRSMEIWHTADPTNPARGLGWLGRISDRILARHPSVLPALHVGSGDLPLALWGEKSFAPTLESLASFRLEGAEEFAEHREELLEVAKSREPEVDFLRSAAKTTYAVAERLEKALERGPAFPYPPHELARQLGLVARVIAGGLETRLFYVELDGFDTHARQAATHAALLTELSESLAAFQRDLDASGVADRVATFVFSEFGRRTEENGSRGTDHGAGAPAFVVGSRVRGGLHGTPPDLERLEEGDVPFSTDFRSIYAALENSWLGFAPSSALAPLELLSPA